MRSKALYERLESFAVVVTVIALAGCSSAPSPTTTAPTTQPTVSSTFGQLAQAGQALYTAQCASCHGDTGQGNSAPALWGTGSHLNDFGNAQTLVNYESGAMPPGAAASLSHQEHIDIVCFLLLQNSSVTSNTMFNESQLGSILLTS